MFKIVCHAITPDKSPAMKMALTPIENKRFTAQCGAVPIFMLGGAYQGEYHNTNHSCDDRVLQSQRDGGTSIARDCAKP